MHLFYYFLYELLTPFYTFLTTSHLTSHIIQIIRTQHFLIIPSLPLTLSFFILRRESFFFLLFSSWESNLETLLYTSITASKDIMYKGKCIFFSFFSVGWMEGGLSCTERNGTPTGSLGYEQERGMNKMRVEWYFCVEEWLLRAHANGRPNGSTYSLETCKTSNIQQQDGWII
jgi:hypothetical protein